MNDTLLQDSLKLLNHTLANRSGSQNTINLWMWLSIIEFAFIIFLLLRSKSKRVETAKVKFKNESLKENIDFDNIINSSFNSTQLYDELKVKCHPDRFPNDEGKNTIAQLIFQEITKNKTNIKRILELKEEAKQKLNINF
jgi:hypothetical protein